MNTTNVRPSAQNIALKQGKEINEITQHKKAVETLLNISVAYATDMLKTCPDDYRASDR